MARHREKLPSYRFHKASGQARVTLSGTDFYLGPYGSKASKREYDRLIGEWLAAGRRLPDVTKVGSIAVVELLASYWQFASKHYRTRDGNPTKELDNIRYALRPLRRLYGGSRVNQFGPLALKALQHHLVKDGLCRTVINSRIGKIKRVFKWAVSEQLCPPAVLHGLQAVPGLQRDRTDAREPEPVEPVDDTIVDATIAHLPSVVADMVRFQRFVGCRPGEVCSLRPCDVDRAGKIWVYRPASHKMQHAGRERLIFIGPKAQDILRSYLLRSAETYCFSPADSEQRRRREMRAKRKSKVQPSQKNRAKRNPRTKPGGRYSKNAYARANSERAAKAFPPPEGIAKNDMATWIKDHRWSPNQLRHAAATEIRRKFGLEAAQVVLGHSRADVTQVYAERDQTLAEKVMGEVG